MQDWTSKDFVEVIGIAAIVASLVFVGLQMKQTQEIALANQYQARAETSMNFYLMNMETGRGDFFLTGKPTDEWTFGELAYGYWTANYFWTKYENHHYQYISGFLANETWNGLKSRIEDLWQTCEIRWAFEDNIRHAARASFVKYLESLPDPCNPEDAFLPRDWPETHLSRRQIDTE